MTLPYDTARCINAAYLRSCRQKEPGHPTQQWQQRYEGGDDCAGHISAIEGGC